MQVPSRPLKFGAFTARFDSGRTFTLEGDRWPSMGGAWKIKGDEIELLTSGAPRGCEGPGRYRLRVDGERVSFDVIADECRPRRMILDRSIWSPAGEMKAASARRIVRTGGRSPAPAHIPGTRPGVGRPSAARMLRARRAAESPDRWTVRRARTFSGAHRSRTRTLQPRRLGEPNLRHECRQP